MSHKKVNKSVTYYLNGPLPNKLVDVDKMIVGFDGVDGEWNRSS